MNTNTLNSMIKEGLGRSFAQKLLFASLIIAMLFASLPAAGASAAPASANGPTLHEIMEASWSAKILKVRAASIFYERVRVYPADFKDPAELARAHDLLREYGIALRRAQTIVFNRAGFDLKGRVIDEKLAAQSIKDLGTNLHTMRSILKKLDRLEGNYRILPAGSITGTASQ